MEDSGHIFQNISCLRLIDNPQTYYYMFLKFQNISCLRLIKQFYWIIGYLLPFQNISCLRLICRGLPNI